MSKAVKTRRSSFEDSLTEDGRYRLLVQAIRDYAIYMLDTQGIVTNWNAGAQRFKGYAAADIVGQHFSRFYTAEDRARGLPLEALQLAEREGKFETEGWRVRKDGTRFWAHVVIDPIREPSGRLIGFAKITRDLTERKDAEDAFSKSEQQFRILVQGVTDYAVYMLAPDGIVSSWNVGAQRIKGYLPSEIIGQHFSVFYTDEDREAGEPQRGLDTAAKTGKFEKEGWRIRKDGTKFWAHIVLDAIRDENGTLIGFAKITRDITERRQAMRELDKARDALFQSQKTEAIGQLTGGVAHDFNNLLSVIYGSLELLQRKLADPKLIALVENALQGAKRGTALSQRMLAFARRQDLRKERIEIPALVQGMGDLLRRSIGPEIRLETRFPLRLSAIDGDPNQIESALLNLVINARDAIHGEGQIVLNAREEKFSQPINGLKAGTFVCVSVTDTGEGMEDETLRRATEPFYTTKGIGMGTGLGLSMAQGLSEQSGGTLMIRSRKHQGTTVEMWFPAAAARVDSITEAIVSKAPDVSGPLCVLAVDDDSLVLMGTVAMLEDLGHTVYEATSGEAALDILRRTAGIKLVITDQAMPKMTGLVLTEQIRNEFPSLRVIIATGYAELPKGQGVPLPILNKPFLQADLSSAIDKAMAARQNS